MGADGLGDIRLLSDIIFRFICVQNGLSDKIRKKRMDNFLFFAGAAFLREAGIQHWLTFTDSTAFKLRFFTNPNNPFSEKIIAFLCLLSISGLFIYTMFLYLIPSVKGFF